jgi:hypothetical protein
MEVEIPKLMIREAGTEEILPLASDVSQTGLTKWTECFDPVRFCKSCPCFFAADKTNGIDWISN